MTMADKLIHALALLGGCALMVLSACGSEAPQGTTGSELPANAGTPGQVSAPNQAPSVESTEGGRAAEEAAGSIALALKLGDQELASMSYAIVGAGFSKSGSLDVSHSSKVSGIIGGIPFGHDYALTMNGKGVGPAPLVCSGSNSFDLNGPGPLPISIQITCKEPTVVAEPTPAPVPPFAILALSCVLAALGFAVQLRRSET